MTPTVRPYASYASAPSPSFPLLLLRTFTLNTHIQHSTFRHFLLQFLVQVTGGPPVEINAVLRNLVAQLLRYLSELIACEVHKTVPVASEGECVVKLVPVKLCPLPIDILGAAEVALALPILPTDGLLEAVRNARLAGILVVGPQLPA